MSGQCQHCARLEAEIERWRWRIEELEGLASERAPLGNLYGLSDMEQRILTGLLKRGSMTTDQLCRWLHPSPDDAPADTASVLRVMVYRMRQKFKPHGVEIQTIWGSGYRLTPESIERVRADMSRLQQGVAA